MTRKIFITICLVALFSVIASAGDNNSNTPLRFSKNGKFKIVQFKIAGVAKNNSKFKTRNSKLPQATISKLYNSKSQA